MIYFIGDYIILCQLIDTGLQEFRRFAVHYITAAVSSNIAE